MIPDEDPEFLREVWGLYGIGVLTILLRFATRLKTVGIKGFQGDDYMNILVLIFYTLDAVMVHSIYFTGSNVEASVYQLTKTLTAEEIAGFVTGSKEQFVAWYSYTALIWCLKGSMLFFFNRLTVGLWQHRFIKWLALVCAVCYVAVFLTITFGCYPTYKNWQVVPDPGEKCTVKLQNFLVAASLNVITDAMILAVPVPLLWALRVPLKRKIVIALLLCSGLFVITAAIIRVALSLGNSPSALNINRWGVRETIVGIVAINLPILRPLFNKSFWSFGTFKSTSYSNNSSQKPYGRGTGKGAIELCSQTNGQKNMWKGHTQKGSKSDDSLEQIPSVGAGSQEFIIQGNQPGNNMWKGVTVERTFQVETVDVEKGDSRQGWRYDGEEVVSKSTVQARRQNGTGQ